VIIRTKDFKNKVAISHSRLKTFSHCSQKYYATYFLKIPDAGNDGSNRGSCAHDTLELLGVPKRKDLTDKLIAEGTCKNHPALWRFVKNRAAKYKVGDEENLNIIDGFLITGLKSGFWGPQGTIHTFIEKDFDIEVEGDGINCRIKGFIDKFFIYRALESLYIRGIDFKGSKKKHNEEDLTAGQGLMYQLALWFLYPTIPLKEFDFVFLKFPKDPYQSYTPVKEGALMGYLYYLTEIQRQINAFTEKDIPSNYGKLNDKMRFLCGPAKSGWICPHQNPLDYFILLNDKGEIIKSSFKDDFSPKERERVELKRYLGCQYFFNKEGRRIRS
jgi:hypothetical protein